MIQTVEVLSTRSEVRRHVDIACDVVSDYWDVPIEHQELLSSSAVNMQMFEQPQRVAQPVERGAAYARIAVTGQFEQRRIAVGEALQRAQALAGITMAPRRRTAEQAGEDHR